MSKVFISYRRNDTKGFAGRLYDVLVDVLGEEHVFRDVDGIDPGLDYVDVLKRTLDNVDALMVLIGPDWISSADQAGLRRLDNPSDLVRLEISHSLERDIVVMPLLVEGATMPKPEELPDDLQPLCRRQYLELADKRWDSDVERILEALGNQTGLSRRSRRSFLLTGFSAIAAGLAGVAIWKTWFGDSPAAAYRTDGCKQGYVWREAFPEDSVCVVTEQADQAKLDNAAASSRIDPDSPYGPFGCLQGYVWRTANESDLVCVEPDVRTRVWQDNETAEVRALPVSE